MNYLGIQYRYRYYYQNNETIALTSLVALVVARDSRIDLADLEILYIIAEDGSTYLVAEDGSTFIIAEHGGKAGAVQLESRIFLEP